MKRQCFALIGFSAICCVFVHAAFVHAQSTSATGSSARLAQTTIDDQDSDDIGRRIVTLRGVLAEAEQGALRIARQVPQADQAGSKAKSDGVLAIRKRLRREVQAAFSARQQLQLAELQRLRQQMVRIEKSIAAREKIKDGIIDRRVEELLDPNLRWKPADQTPNAKPRIASDTTGKQNSANPYARNAEKRIARNSPARNTGLAQIPQSSGAGLRRATATNVLDPQDGVVRIAKFTPDGKTVVAGGNRFVTVLDVRTGKTLMKLQGHSKTVSWLDISPDGSNVAACSKDGIVRLYDLPSGKALRTFAAEARQSLWSVSFSPDGKMLAACTNQDLYLWEISTGKLNYQVRVEAPRSFTRVCFAPDGGRLAVAETRGMVTVFDIENQLEPRKQEIRQRFQVQHEGRQYVSHCRFSNDGKTLLTSGYDFTIRQWDANDGKLLRTMESEREPQAAVYSRDGARILSVTKNETIQLWDAATGKELDSIKGTDHEIRGLALSSDGRYLATYGEDNVVKIWRVTGASVAGEKRPENPGSAGAPRRLPNTVPN